MNEERALQQALSVCAKGMQPCICLPGDLGGTLARTQPQDSPSAVSARAYAPSPSSPLQSQSPAGQAKGGEEDTRKSGRRFTS